MHWNIENIQNGTLELARGEARTNWNKDQAFRRWATLHGGVYVKPDERTPPNPYLAHIPNRDVVTVDGDRLTLMNPAYMMRQLTEEYEATYGVKGRITGKITLNPKNQPDSWELSVLDRFEKESIKEVTAESLIDGQPYLRYMKPMYMTKGCVKCHGVLGFKEGDLRGGVSVSVPLTPYLDSAAETAASMKVTHSVVWIIGILGFVSFARFVQYRQKERLKLLADLEHSALYDPLTALPNRILFSDRSLQAIKMHQRNKSYKYAICFLDLDRFKNLNDSFGHTVGDQLLQQVGSRFLSVVRPSDTVARMGGDEFTFLFDGIDGLREAVFVAERLLAAVREPFNINGQTMNLDASIGLCLGNARYNNPDEIIRDADTAMYRAKSQGKGRIDIFDPEMHEAVMHVTRIEHDLHNALASNQFTIHYQPIVQLNSGRIEGFEALLRWQHPDLGMIPPDVFVPIAEDTGVIHAIGACVLEESCRQIRDWSLQYAKGDDFFVAVNISAKQVIQNDFPRQIEKILTQSRFAARNLHCEVTETHLILEQSNAEKNMAELRNLGVHLSADDFGKGFSSLTYLQKYSFDTLKIDKEFVQNMNPNGRGLKLVRTMLMLAKDLGMSEVAEGVETQDQLDRLKALHCGWAQGYFLFPPAPAEKIEDLLRAGCHKNLPALRNKNPHYQRMTEAV